jgi:hypothetical protein
MFMKVAKVISVKYKCVDKTEIDLKRLLKKSESKYWLNQVSLLKRLRLGLSVQTKTLKSKTSRQLSTISLRMKKRGFNYEKTRAMLQMRSMS